MATKIKSIHKYLIIILLTSLLVSQTFIIYFVFVERIKLLEKIQETETEISEKIELNNKDLQNKINSLITSITSISTEQTNLLEQLGEIKASTSADFSGIIENEIKGVVTIKTDVSQGTGFLITDQGFVVTNYHVISGARLANVHTYDNEAYSAELIGFNAVMDIALLKISGSFHSLDLGDSDDVKIGEKVLAIGNPLGLAFTVTEGIISAKDRQGINNLPYYLQTDVSLNPGNSGGPLINTKGEVIGINNFKVSGAESLGFALEINPAIDTINEIALQALNETIV